MENILNYYYQLNIIDIKKKDYYYLLTTDEYEQYIFNEIDLYGRIADRITISIL